MPYRFIALAIIALVSTGCAGAQPRGIASSEDGASHAAGSSTDGSESDIRAIRSELSSLAEMERRGRYEPGLGIHESGLRERAGDSSGAVFAAYKDLSYAYANGAVSERDIDARLDRLDETAMSDGARDAGVLSAVAAIRLFRSGKWAEAASALIVLAAGDGQADSFADWMALAATMESGSATDEERERYALMQARYSLFPEYWFRFSRIQDRVDLKRDSDDRCIALAPHGPFAEPSREDLAESYGLDKKAGPSLLVRSEIDAVAMRAGRTGDYGSLDALLPVLALPDNPLTLYAVRVLHELCASEPCRAWLRAAAAEAHGRTAERLAYATGR